MYYHNVQSNTTDCGVAVIRTVLQQLGKSVKNNISGSRLFRNGQGMSLLDVSNVLSKSGVNAVPYEITDDNNLKDISIPSIAVVNHKGLNHFVVIHDIDFNTDTILISDPSLPKILKTRIRDFLGLFTGFVLCIEGETIASTNKDISLYRRMLHVVPLREKVACVFVSVLRWCMPLFILGLMQWLLSYHIEDMKGVVAIYATGTFILMSLIHYLLGQMLQSLKNSVENRIINKFSTGFVLNEIASNDSRKRSDTEGIYWNIVMSVTGLFQRFLLNIDILLIALFLAIITFYNLVFALISFGFIVSIVIYGLLMKEKIKFLQTHFINTANALSGCVQEITLSSMDIKIFSSINLVKKYYEKMYNEYQASKNDVDTIDAKMLGMYDLFSYIAVTIGLSYVFIAFNYAIDASASSVTLLFYIMFFMTMTFKTTFQKWIAYRKSYSAIEYIEMMSDTLEYEEHESFHLEVKEWREVRLDKCDMKYENTVVLEDVTLNLSRGTITGICGDNGSGKTTLAKALLGMTDTSGRIFVNNRDYSDVWSNCDVCNYISLYSSELYLYSNSVENNISLEMINEVNGVKVNPSFNILPLDHLVFRDGMNISLGERQRILLDRTFAQDCPIYVFDEPGINLDEQSKKAFIDKTNALRDKGKIVIIISHDDSILSICDNLFEIKEKKIREVIR